MRKPHHGDQLTIRYDGAVLRARCDDITEMPSRGPGQANFSIVSPTQFERGHAAQLLQGPDELAIQVLRVTPVGHHRTTKMNVVLFSAEFDGNTGTAARPA